MSDNAPLLPQHSFPNQSLLGEDRVRQLLDSRQAAETSPSVTSRNADKAADVGADTVVAAAADDDAAEEVDVDDVVEDVVDGDEEEDEAAGSDNSDVAPGDRNRSFGNKREVEEDEEEAVNQSRSCLTRSSPNSD